MSLSYLAIVDHRITLELRLAPTIQNAILRTKSKTITFMIVIVIILMTYNRNTYHFNTHYYQNTLNICQHIICGHSKYE